MKHKHTKDQVIHYIRKHIAKGHDLVTVLDHLKAHHVDPDILHAAVQEITLIKDERVFDFQKIEEERRPTIGDFVAEMQLHDYLIILSVIGLLIISVFAPLITTLVLLGTLFCIGCSYAGSHRWPEISVIVLGVFGFLALIDEFHLAFFIFLCEFAISFVLFDLRTRFRKYD